MTVINFPGVAIPRAESTPVTVEHSKDFRQRDRIDEDIHAHIAAREVYAQAAAWAATAENSNHPASHIEDARAKVAAAFEEMNWRGRCLLVVMPTDPRGVRQGQVKPIPIEGRQLDTAGGLDRVRRNSAHWRMTPAGERFSPRFIVLNWQWAGSMASKEREIYLSANGDRWFLCREGDRVFVLHSANEPSGGKLTPVELEDFLRKGNAGPEHQALRHMIGSLIDQ